MAHPWPLERGDVQRFRKSCSEAGGGLQLRECVADRTAPQDARAHAWFHHKGERRKLTETRLLVGHLTDGPRRGGRRGGVRPSRGPLQGETEAEPRADVSRELLGLQPRGKAP